MTIIAGKQVTPTRRYYRTRLPKAQAERLIAFSHVKYDGTNLSFDRDVFDEPLLRCALLYASEQPIQITTFESDTLKSEVKESDVETINRHSRVKLQNDEIDVFDEFAAHDGHAMRVPLKFTRKALKRFAESFVEGRTVLFNHDPSKPIGRTFDASVRKQTVRGVEAGWLSVRWYAPNGELTADRQQILNDIKTGVLTYDSIEVTGGEWTLVEDDERNTFYFEIEDNEKSYPRLDAGELSKVYLGAVIGAGSKMSNVTETDDDLENKTENEPTRRLICMLP
jgi:hypothetical protein